MTEELNPNPVLGALDLGYSPSGYALTTLRFDAAPHLPIPAHEDIDDAFLDLALAVVEALHGSPLPRVADEGLDPFPLFANWAEGTDCPVLLNGRAAAHPAPPLDASVPYYYAAVGSRRVANPVTLI